MPMLNKSVKVYSVDSKTEQKTLSLVCQDLIEHPLFLQSDLRYYHLRGFSLADIKRIWDWEWFGLFNHFKDTKTELNSKNDLHASF